MTEGNTSSSEPDAPNGTDNATDHPVENTSESGADHDHSDAGSDDATDTSAMARALKHTLEQKDMTVEIEDDGETVSAEKLGQSYRIRPDGTVEGDGVLKDGIENIVADLDPVDTTEAENPETDDKADVRTDSDGSASSADETKSSKESDTPADPTEVESTAAAAEDGSATEVEVTEETAEEEETEVEVEEDTEEDAESLPTGSVGVFEASIEAGHLQQAIDAANAVVDECRVHLDTDGLVIRAVDPANVAMVDEQVSAEAFEAYDTDCGEIGINLERLDEVVGIADNDDDLVQFDLDPKTRKLDVQVTAVEYTLALIDPDAIRAEPDIPDLDWPAAVSMDEAEFKCAIRAADMVSDHINLRVNENEACFIATAKGDTDDVELELAADDLVEADLTDAESLFSLDYMKDLRKPIPKETTIHVQLGTEFPVILGFEMGDGSVDVEYVLAPRIQNV